MKKNNKKIIAVAAVAAMLVVTNLLTFFITATSNIVVGNKILLNASSVTSAKNINKMIYLDKVLSEKYYKDVDEQQLWDTAFKGLFAGTGDTYTKYYTKKEFKSYMEGYEGSYSGIGVQIMNNKKNQVVVDSVFQNTPAEQAGIKPGDIIISIGGKDSTNMDVSDASGLIRGDSGTKVKIVVLRKGKKLTFNITRKTIEQKRVSSKMIGDVGYIAVTEFDENVGRDFEKSYRTLQKKNMKALVIDLRNNPGGLVDEAEDIANLMLKRDSIIISTTNKSGKVAEDRDTTDEYISIPVAVLVNENSASASEILSCALQDNGIAKIVGVKSYGKGIIQTINPFNDGSGATITSDEYVSPKGNKIHKKGITPDITVKAEFKKPIAQLDLKEDNQLMEAVKYLKKKAK